MNTTMIWTIWVNDNPIWDNAWITDAWDDLAIDNNEDGWKEAVSKAKSSYAEVRIIPLKCDSKKLREAFEPSVVEAGVGNH